MLNQNDFPLKRDQIPLATFEKLKEKLLEKLRKEYQLGDEKQTLGSAKFYGMGEWAPDEGHIKPIKTVATVIAGHEEVKKLLSTFPKESEKINFGDYLYKRIREAKDKPDFITFGKRAYIYGYFMFLGYSSREAFEKEFQITNTTIRNNDVEQTVDTVLDIQNKNEPSRFLGSFFSFRSYTVKHFMTSIYFDNPVSNNVFPAEEWGFHRLEDAFDPHRAEGEPDAEQNYRLKGTALVRNNKLYLNLSADPGEQNWTQMNIIGWVYGNQAGQIKGQKFIRCSLQTVSILGYPVSVEAILSKIDEEKWAQRPYLEYQVPTISEVRTFLGNDDTDRLLLYLMMQRRNFWVRDGLLNDLMNLKVRGNLVRNYQYLKGTWRVWNYGLTRGHVVQNKLIINDNYSTYFFPKLKDEILQKKPELKQQVVILSMSRGLQPNKLFLSTFVRPDLSIINNAIFDLDTIDKSPFVEGMFVSGGYTTHGIIGGYCIMKKLLPGEADFEPEHFNWEQAQAYEQKNNLIGLYESLRQLWKRKTWKRKEKAEEQVNPDRKEEL